MKQRWMILGLIYLLTACPTTPSLPGTTAQLYASATTGSDSNPGTSAAPLKTLRKALALVQKGQTVRLEHGTYDVTNGEAFPETVPDGVSLLADNPRDILLLGKASQDGLIFAGSGSVVGLDLQGFGTAITATTGTQAFSNLALSGNTAGLNLSATAQATLDGNSSLKDGEIAVRLTGNAKLAMTGGVVSGMKGSGKPFDAGGLVGGFSTGELSALTLTNVAVKNNLARWTVRLTETSSVTINSSQFTGNGVTRGSGAVIETAGSSRLDLEDTSLFLNNDDGVYVTENSSVTIKGGEISAGMTYGMYIGGASATVVVDGTKINGNQEIGVRLDTGQLELANAEIRGNKLYGIAFHNQAGPGSLKMRNTLVNDNGSVGVSVFFSTTTGQADLGTAVDLGKNTFKGNGIGLDVTGKVIVNASGNTWEPNQQGADASGRYATGLPIVGPTPSGSKNISVATGSTVQL